MNKEHNHATTSNTDEVFRTFIGCTVKGLLHDSAGSGGSTVVLVFDCGWGLAFFWNGNHWTEPPDAVRRILRGSKRQLTATKQELEHLLELAGEKVKSV